MKKVVLGTLAAVALTATLGAGVAKAAWDSNVASQSVNVVIGTSAEITNAKLTGGDLTKTLIPYGSIKGANEVGAIVSMWSMLEAMVSVVLEDGCMTKGNGQNLTAFYFKTEKE